MITEFTPAPAVEGVSPQPFDLDAAFTSARLAIAVEVAYAEQQLAVDTAVVDRDLLASRLNSFCYDAEDRAAKARYRDRMYETLAVHAGFVPDKLPVPLKHKTAFTAPTMIEALNTAVTVAESNQAMLERHFTEDLQRPVTAMAHTVTPAPDIAPASEVEPRFLRAERSAKLLRAGKRIGAAAVSLAVIGADVALSLAAKQHVDHSQYMEAAKDSFGVYMATAAIGARFTQLMYHRRKRRLAI